MKKPSAFLAVVSVVSTSFLFGNQNQTGPKVYTTARLSGNPPSIDGRLNDPCWQGGNWEGGFLQRTPYPGEPATENTVFKVLYDDKNLYVAVRAHDSEPEGIAQWGARRDDQVGDIVGFAIDSYNDHRTAFEFNLTAAGGKSDAILIDTEKRYKMDRNWDPVWYGKVAMEDSAWTAEMQIPFSQLRFAKKDEYTWGIHCWRMIRRKQEDINWTYKPKDAAGLVRFFGELRGITGIGTPHMIELLPYASGKASTYKKQAGNPFATGRQGSAAGGLDGKIGISSDFTLDFTVNPDFGQVEADPSVMNLTAFETFFTEKRPFFIEGKEILTFQLDEDYLFYSRRIGHYPGYTPQLEKDEYVKMPESTSILSALKLTGKTKDGLSVGILESLTAEEKATIDHQGITRSQAVEPLSNYFVGRFQKDYDQGNVILGGMVSSTNRSLSAEPLKFLNRSAYTGGLDLRWQWRDKTYYLQMKTIFSNILGDKQAMVKVQRSSAHYFQRPDAGHVDVDSSRTGLFGHGGLIEIGKGGGGVWRFSEGVSWRSPGFELNDLGYLRMADIVRQTTSIGYDVTKPTGIFLGYSLYLDQLNHWDFGGTKLMTQGGMNAIAQFKNFWQVSSDITRGMTVLDTRVLRGGPALKRQGNWDLSGSLASDRRKSFRLILSGRTIRSDDGISASTQFGPAISLRASNALDVSGDVSYATNIDDLQYVTTKKMLDGSRYVLARIRQKTLGITLRLNYSLSPELTLQYYGQPFVSAGTYSHFKKVTDPRNSNHSDRFHEFSNQEMASDPSGKTYTVDENLDGLTDYTFTNPNFNFRQFRSNLVIRWEYKAGSALYLVWSQGRTGSGTSGEFSFGRDFRDLYDVYPQNIFMIKFNHWFSL